MDRFFRIRSHREGSTGVLVADGNIEWLSGGLDAGVFGTPRVDPAFGDPNDLDEFDRIDRKAQVRKFPLEVKLTGANEQAIIDTQGDLLAEIADCNEWGGTIRYRPEGLDYPVNLDLLDIAVGDGKGVWAHSAEGFRYLKMSLEVSVQPWAFTDPMSIDDLFETDTLSATGGIYNDGAADWTADIDTDLLTLQQQGLEEAALAATDWTDYDAAYSTITRSSAQAYAGTYSLAVAMDQNAGAAAMTPQFGVTPGMALSASARARTSSANGSDVIGITVEFFDAAGSPIAGSFSSTPTAVSNSAWTQHTCSGTVPATAVTGRFRLNYSGTGILIGDVIYWDDMHVLASPTIADTWVFNDDRIEASTTWAVETRLIHSGSRWEYADPLTRIAFHAGGTNVTGQKFGTIFKWIDDDNYLEAYVEYTGSNHVLRVAKVVAGVRTVLNTSSSLGTLTGRILLDVAMQGNRIYAAASSSNQAEILRAPIAMTFQRALSVAVEPLFCTGTRGRVGMVLRPMNTAANVSWFRAADGVLNVGMTTPRNSRLSAPIPTAASPVFEVHCGNNASLSARAFFAMGWWDRPRPLNHIDALAQASGGYGWSNGTVTGVQGAAGVALAAGSAPPPTSPNTSSIRVGASAASDAGGTFYDRGRLYEAGKTYVLEFDARLNSGSGSLRAKLGVNGDLQLGNQTFTSTWETATQVKWTPSADRNGAYLAFVSNGSATATWDITNVRVWEETADGSEPTLFSGGFLPVGEIPCVRTTVNGGGGVETTDASSVHGLVWQRNGAGTCGVTLPITTHPLEDPAEDIVVDYFVLCKQDNTISGVTFTAYQTDVDDSGGTLKQYAEPFGTTGKPVGVLPSSGTDRRRWYYLGRLAWSKTDYQRTLVVSATVTGSGNFALDTVVGLPADACILTPTGTADADLASELHGVVIEPDLRVRTHSGQARASRLGGSLLRMTPGMRTECVVFTADAYLPDSTTSSSDTNAATESNRNLIAVPRPRVYLNETVGT